MGNPVRSIELHCQQVALLGQGKLLGIPLTCHQVIGETIEKLQIRAGRLQLEQRIQLLRALIKTVSTQQGQCTAQGFAGIRIHPGLGDGLQQSR